MEYREPPWARYAWPPTWRPTNPDLPGTRLHTLDRGGDNRLGDCKRRAAEAALVSIQVLVRRSAPQEHPAVHLRPKKKVQRIEVRAVPRILPRARLDLALRGHALVAFEA